MAKQTSRASRRRNTRRIRAIVLGVGVTAAIVVGYFGYRAWADLPGVKMPDQGNRHLASESDSHEPYNSTPPTSGPHLPYIAPWGIHTRPIARELQVHNLEDGGVLIQYNCECPELVEKLRALVRNWDKYVILAPYPGMPHRIALTAWTRIDAFDDFDERRISRFVRAYRGIDHHK